MAGDVILEDDDLKSFEKRKKRENDRLKKAEKLANKTNKTNGSNDSNTTSPKTSKKKGRPTKAATSIVGASFDRNPYDDDKP